jgi:hypothetical protein
MLNQDQLKKDIEFLLSFLPATEVDQVEPGLSPFFYITNCYEGDVKLMQKVSDIKARYGVTVTESEEDFAE